MKVEKVLRSPNEIGRLWLVDVHPVVEYKDGARTDHVIAYKYDIVAIDLDAEKFSVKIPGAKLMDAPAGHAEVTLDNPQWVVYSLNNRVGLSCKATGIKTVKH